jgi:hypothetical protein
MTALLSVLLIAAMVGPLGILWLAESRLQGHRTDLAILERRMERLDRELAETLGGLEKNADERMGRSESAQRLAGRIARSRPIEESPERPRP